MNDEDWFDRQKLSATTRPWWFWRYLLRFAGGPIVGTFGRLAISGSISPELLRGPLLIAPNHIGNVDAFGLSAAMGRIGLEPRFLVTAGIMQAPVAGKLLERSGNLRVNRGREDAQRSMELIKLSLHSGAHLVIYPEGRLTLDPDWWPERGRTGLARLALEHQIPVIPVSQWGAHEIIKYENPKAMLGSLVSSVWRQPRVQIHFGAPVDLSGLEFGRTGDANRARNRIDGAITRGVRVLRKHELDHVKFADETRPAANHTIAAFPGGIVPDSLP